MRDTSSEEGGLSVQLHYALPPAAVAVGAPRRLVLLLHAPPDSADLQLSLVWADKAATRIPEALWLRFHLGPGAADPAGWRLHKLGSAIRPDEVRRGGNGGGWAGSRVDGQPCSGVSLPAAPPESVTRSCPLKNPTGDAQRQLQHARRGR